MSEIQELYNRLTDAYSDKNLNRITGKLIQLQKNKYFGKIREIANKISPYVLINEERDMRCFSRLITLYHPDKAPSVREEMRKHFQANDLDRLNKYAHIFLLDNMDNMVVESIYEDLDYSPEYGWDDYADRNFSSFDPFRTEEEEPVDDREYENTFMNAVRLRIYGDLDMDFPTYYLEDYEYLEMASSNIEYLDGIEYCKHVEYLDLSDNELSEISELCSLKRIEELNLADNNLTYIDALSRLINLKILDLSGNQIEDVAPLFTLEKLQYVDITGNKIPQYQKESLRDQGVIVVG